MFICERCGKEHDGSFGSGRFCSVHCANSRVQTDEINEKRRLTLRKNIENGNVVYKGSFTGKTHTEQAKKKISDSIKIWRSNLSEEVKSSIKQKLSDNNPSKRAEVKAKLSSVARRLGSKDNYYTKHKQGWYKGVFCQSTWELAFLVYCLDKGEHIERNNRGFQYPYNNTIRTYFPDFYFPDEDTYVEISGYDDEKKLAKYSHFKYNLIILHEKEMKPILQYCYDKYGYNLSKLYE